MATLGLVADRSITGPKSGGAQLCGPAAEVREGTKVVQPGQRLSASDAFAVIARPIGGKSVATSPAVLPRRFDRIFGGETPFP